MKSLSAAELWAQLSGSPLFGLTITLIAYLAGSMQAQLTAGKAVDSPIPGWEFALKAYLAIQKSDGQFKLDELEALKKQQAKGELPKLAKQALQKP